MNSLELNKVISDLFREKIQGKNKVVHTLSDILDMDKKSVYRRLNSEVFFTFAEICKISAELGISLDGLVKNDLYGIRPNGFILYSNAEKHIDKILDAILRIKLWATNISIQSTAIMCHVSNILPISFWVYDKELLQFYYYYKNCMKVNRPFSKVKEEEHFIRITDMLYELAQEYINMKQYYFIMNRNPAAIIMHNLSFYRNIRLLTEEEFNRLKRKISEYFDILEDVTQTGYFGSNKAYCAVYVSDLYYNSSFYYFCSDTDSFSSIQMYMLGRHVSYDKECNDLLKLWFKEMMGASVLITQSNFNRRIQFFEEQREVIKKY